MIVVVDVQGGRSNIGLLMMVFADRRVGILDDRRCIVLMEQGAFKHHDHSLVHIDSCLLDGFEEPDLSPLEPQQLQLSLLFVSLDMLLDHHLLIVGKVLTTVPHVLFIVHHVAFFEIRKTFLVVFHERFENFADAFYLCRHSLAHPNSSLHIFLLVVGISTFDVLEPIQILFQLIIFGFHLLPLLLHLGHDVKGVFDHFDTGWSILEPSSLLLPLLQLIKLLVQLSYLAFEVLPVLLGGHLVEARSENQLAF